MTATKKARKDAGGGCVAWGLFLGLFFGLGGFLTVVLVSECGAGSDAVDAYVAGVRAGEEVTAAVGGDEADALTRVLRQSRETSVHNFQGQAGTACYWVGFEGDGAGGEVRFLLGDRGRGLEVVEASLRRGCECPDRDVEAPCRLR